MIPWQRQSREVFNGDNLLKYLDTFPEQRLLPKVVDHPEEEDDSDGDEEELEDRVHPSSITTNLVAGEG